MIFFFQLDLNKTFHLFNNSLMEARSLYWKCMGTSPDFKLDSRKWSTSEFICFNNNVCLPRYFPWFSNMDILSINQNHLKNKRTFFLSVFSWETNTVKTLGWRQALTEIVSVTRGLKDSEFSGRVLWNNIQFKWRGCKLFFVSLSKKEAVWGIKMCNSYHLKCRDMQQ